MVGGFVCFCVEDKNSVVPFINLVLAGENLSRQYPSPHEKIVWMVDEKIGVSLTLDMSRLGYILTISFSIYF